jgi:hypothetical protein
MPGYYVGGVNPKTAAFRRQEAAMLTACIITLVDAFKRSPKPIATVADLLEKFGLLQHATGTMRGSPRLASANPVTALEALRKREARYRARASEPTTAVGKAILMLRQSFAQTFVQVRVALPANHVAKCLTRLRRMGITDVDALAWRPDNIGSPKPSTGERRPRSSGRARPHPPKPT